MYNSFFFISNSFITYCARFYRMIEQLQQWQIFGNSTDKQLIAFLLINKKIITCANLQMSEFERKLYLKYFYISIIRKKTIFKIFLYVKYSFLSNSLICKFDAITKYDAIIMPQVISIQTFYTSKCNSFYFFPYLNVLQDCTRKNLSNQLSNSSTNFGLGTKQPKF